MSVGVMKDYKLKLKNLHDSTTLGWSWNDVVYYESIKWEPKIRCIYGTGTPKDIWEGAKSGVTHLERMKHGSGIKGRDDRSSGIEILMTDVFVKIQLSDPLRLVKQVAQRKCFTVSMQELFTMKR
jgi:hypothetical protein